MRKSMGLLVVLLLCCILLMPVSAQDLDITSTPPLVWTYSGGPVTATYDFGDVVLGESRTATFSFDSIGPSAVRIYYTILDDTPLAAQPFASPDWEPYLYCWGSFCFNSLTYRPTRPTPIVLNEGENYPLDVTFTPVSIGEQSVYLDIYSDDAYPPPGSVAAIRLVGTGVNGPTPEEQIDEIQEFFDDAVTSGELVGVGATKTAAAGKLDALENMLEQAEYLIDIDDVEGACTQLQHAYQKTDGLWLPPDFVAGSAGGELATMIQDLRESLGCE